MKAIKVLLIVFAMFFFLGCATIKPYYDDERKIISNKNYVIGEIKTSYVGDVMIDVSDYILQGSNEVEVAKSFSVKEGIFARNDITFLSGVKYLISGIIETNGTAYKALRLGTRYDGSGFYLLIGDDNRPYKIYDPFFWATPYDIEVTPLDAGFKKVFVAIGGLYSDVAPRYQLIYNGANDVSFFLSYREFTIGDLARVAFYQDLTYAIKQKTIRFKNFIIQVDKADNEEIIFRVIKD